MLRTASPNKKDPMRVTCGAILVLTLVNAAASAPTQFSQFFLGLNNGEHETVSASFADPLFQAAMAPIMPAVYRYPAGTAANYWDWRAGKCHSAAPSQSSRAPRRSSDC